MRRRAWRAAVALLVLAGCGGAASPAPPEIQYGLEECGTCRMILSEERFASAAVDEAGGTVAFDDLGCLLDYLHQHPDHRGTLWVHDFSGGGWLAATRGAFVRGPRAATPMGSGVVAFASPEAAAAFARDHGADVVSWEALLAAAVESAPE